MIQVLLAEDQRVLRDALVSLLELEQDIEVIGATDCGGNVVPLTTTRRPDVVILDIGLPDISGLAVASELRRQCPDIRILLLTSLDKPGTVREALSAGVDGFLPKGVTSGELVTGIRQVHAGKRVVSPDLVSAALAIGENPLTPRERSILQLAAAGTPPPEIANQLFLAEGTVRNHITRVIGKLSARNATDAVRIADQLGWL
ncbi:response regulator transcription factor [Amycolatopsis cihanbeyliensis]|uniref:LuxR family two component transcriptional regulator n=1 Tax=Amycolatopsis cihanbeyliensis TaxID=1128664 RepID=A0A542DBX1_AMYCI|nr:response regulator transcription factor [Amycolatopsis cihanbeyliensis]TQJ00564.1 LuxR family two component transcriptional regulator [Amycolatopsis cihanbeyliensis]